MWREHAFVLVTLGQYMATAPKKSRAVTGPHIYQEDGA